ncbi:hypothetical protein [Streptomyces sp. NBC_00582]|uniref:hypothetical protein n=1 Tax=Streptomyces sp. NBC_00582 TaxID=2975783 RepID=UPI002E804FC7|nr:hypothetical protein [Streptomyces sp. NBC_00582]WUB63846.1 hypothetical protein OG852_27370 [Streptomyces sp. NBC_00582]
MNTKALNSLADVICRAQEQDRTPMGIAFAIDSAGRHMSPETAAEMERLRAKVAELEATPTTVFRAQHDSIVMGLYTTAAEARKHCETELLREYADSTKVSLWWREDEDTVDQPEDGEAELFAHVIPRGLTGRVWRTGYVVTPLEVAAKFDEGADE